jgi:hypothetical protein
MANTHDYDDYDQVIVDRIIVGHRVGAPIPAPEAAEATRRLAAMGFSDGQIAARLGFTRRAVWRIRRRRGIPAALPVPSNQCTRTVEAPTRPRIAG